MYFQRLRPPIILVLVFALAMLAGPATAQEHRAEAQASAQRAHALAEQVFTSEDPARAFEALTASDQELLRLGTDVVEQSEPVVVSMEVSPMSPGCWTVSSYVYGSNAFGAHLWRYWLTIDWCINTSNQVYWGTMTNRWAETLYPGWRFERHVQTGDRLLTFEYRRFTQGHFTLGAGGWDVQHTYPCVQLRGYWNATANVYASCAI